MKPDPDLVAIAGRQLAPAGDDSTPLLQFPLRANTDSVRPNALFHGHYHRRYDSEVVGPGDGNAWTCIVRGLDCDGGRLRDNVIFVETNSMRVVK